MIRADIRSGDHIYVGKKIATPHRMAFRLAIEHTKQEIARFDRDLTAVDIAGTSLSDISRMDSQPLAAHRIVHEVKISRTISP